MKKFAKMSLVAAVAVAGLTSANAGSLEEAIKGVDISGTVVYRYNDYDGDDLVNPSSKEGTTNYYKAVVNVKSPINDDLALNASVAANNNFAGFDTGTASDTNVAVELTKVNFVYTGLANTTLIVGKQGVPTPWTVASDSDGAEQTGTGALALVNVGPVTLAGAYFNQTNFGAGGTDIAVLGAMGNFAGVSLDAWYADQIDTLESYTVGAGYKLDLDAVNLGFSVRHTELEVDGATVDNELTKAKVTAKMGIFDASVAYGETGKNGGVVAFDASAKTAMEGWNTNLSGQADADYLQLHVGAQVLPQLNVAVNYFERSDDTVANTNDAEELYTQITWKPSKNFYTYVRLGQYEEKAGAESDVGRLQVQYTF